MEGDSGDWLLQLGEKEGVRIAQENGAALRWGNRIRRTVAALRPEIQHSGDSPAPALDKMQNQGGEGCCTGVRRGKMWRGKTGRWR
jgi:hypothetical protein